MCKKVLLSLLICLNICVGSAVLGMKNTTSRIEQDFFNTKYGFCGFRELAISHIFPYLIDTSSVESFVRDMVKYSLCRSWRELLYKDYFLREAKKRIIKNKLMTYLPKTDIFDRVLDVNDFVHKCEDGTGQIIMDSTSNNVFHYIVKIENFDRFERIIELVKEKIEKHVKEKAKKLEKGKIAELVKKVFHKIINMKNGKGLTPLHILQNYQKGEKKALIRCLNKLFKQNKKVKLLKKNGADANIVQGVTQKDKDFSEAILNNDFIKVKALLQQGVNINVQGKSGSTPLHWACDGNSVEIVRLLLLEKGVNIHAEDIYGRTPFYKVCDRYSIKTEIVKQLIKKGTFVNTRNKSGRTPLHCACWKENEEIVKLLLDANAALNAQDDDGNTPLHKACDGGNFEIVRLLLKKNTKVNIRNNYNEIPLDIVRNRIMNAEIAEKEKLKKIYVLFDKHMKKEEEVEGEGEENEEAIKDEE